jgi:hypothetical protein
MTMPIYNIPEDLYPDMAVTYLVHHVINEYQLSLAAYRFEDPVRSYSQHLRFLNRKGSPGLKYSS